MKGMKFLRFRAWLRIRSDEFLLGIYSHRMSPLFDEHAILDIMIGFGYLTLTIQLWVKTVCHPFPDECKGPVCLVRTLLDFGKEWNNSNY